jgi:hypothetical protein
VVEASKRPRLYQPLVAAGEPPMLAMALLPGIGKSRDAARVLKARAMFHLGSDEVEKAWDDLLACHRLARLVGHGPTLVDALVAIAIDGIALAGDRAIFQHTALTARQAKRMYDDLGKLPPVCKMADQIDAAERFICLDVVCHCARDGFRGFREFCGSVHAKPNTVLGAIFEGAVRVTVDWDVCLRMANSAYNRMADAYRKPNRDERNAAFERIDKEARKVYEQRKDAFSLPLKLLGGKTTVSEQVGNALLSVMGPPLSRVANAEDRSRMWGEVTRLGFALAAFKADRGAYPEKLAELRPQYVAAIPIDIFSGGEPRYRREDKGYILYSVGLNGKDDGGRGVEDQNAKMPESCNWDDLVVRVRALK